MNIDLEKDNPFVKPNQRSTYDPSFSTYVSNKKQGEKKGVPNPCKSRAPTLCMSTCVPLCEREREEQRDENPKSKAPHVGFFTCASLPHLLPLYFI